MAWFTIYNIVWTFKTLVCKIGSGEGYTWNVGDRGAQWDTGSAVVLYRLFLTEWDSVNR